MAIGGSDGDSEGLGGFLDRQPGEVAQFDHFALPPARSAANRSRLRPGPAGLSSAGARILEQAVEVDALQFAAVPYAVLAAGVFDENPPHRLGRRGKEVAAAVPVLRLRFASNQPQIRLVDQGRGLERLARLLLEPSSCAASLRSSS